MRNQAIKETFDQPKRPQLKKGFIGTGPLGRLLGALRPIHQREA